MRALYIHVLFYLCQSTGQSHEMQYTCAFNQQRIAGVQVFLKSIVPPPAALLEF